MENAQQLTIYKKHRTDKDFMKFSAFKNILLGRQESSSESPTIFYKDRYGQGKMNELIIKQE